MSKKRWADALGPCSAAGCDEPGMDIANGRLYCHLHYFRLLKCACKEDWRYLLPGDGCDRCGFANEQNALEGPAGDRVEISEISDMGFPPVLSGFKRQWVKCRICGRVAYYDFVPFSLANPVMTLPCGHGAAQRFYEAVEDISDDEALRLIHKGQ